MGMLAGVGSIIGGAMGLFGSHGAKPQNANIGPIMGNLDANIPQLSQWNLGGQNFGQYANTLQNYENNPYGGLGLGLGVGFGGLGIDQSLRGIGNANTLASGVSPLMNAAFDPQNALYDRTSARARDQQLAGLSASGLATTPYGQGVFGENMNNFNIDWENNALGRMIAGSGAATQLGQGAMNLGGQAATAGAEFGMLPYNLYKGITSDQLGGYERGAAYGQQSAAIPQMQIQDWLAQLSGANQANAVAVNQQKQNFSENMMYGSAIGSGLNMVGRSSTPPWMSSLTNMFG